MEQAPYVFEVRDGRTVTATRVIQRGDDGRVYRSFLVDGDIDGDHVELERLARRWAGFSG
jgi:hypothetical protein